MPRTQGGTHCPCAQTNVSQMCPARARHFNTATQLSQAPLTHQGEDAAQALGQSLAALSFRRAQAAEAAGRPEGPARLPGPHALVVREHVVHERQTNDAARLHRPGGPDQALRCERRGCYSRESEGASVHGRLAQQCHLHKPPHKIKQQSTHQIHRLTRSTFLGRHSWPGSTSHRGGSW